MLSRDMYTDEYIRELQRRTGNDPALLERVVYAFGLLEAMLFVIRMPHGYSKKEWI